VDTPESVAIYVGVLRHALALPPGSDALAELEARLAPPDAAQRPPSRAPGIARLTKALKAMRSGKAPADTIAEFREDLRFLRMFDRDTSWTREALDDLMANVIVAPPGRSTRRAKDGAANTPGKIVPLRPPAPRRGDA
jgi:hypothetical protein